MSPVFGSRCRRVFIPCRYFVKSGVKVHGLYFADNQDHISNDAYRCCDDSRPVHNPSHTSDAIPYTVQYRAGHTFSLQGDPIARSRPEYSRSDFPTFDRLPPGERRGVGLFIRTICAARQPWPSSQSLTGSGARAGICMIFPRSGVHKYRHMTTGHSVET